MVVPESCLWLEYRAYTASCRFNSSIRSFIFEIDFGMAMSFHFLSDNFDGVLGDAFHEPCADSGHVDRAKEQKTLFRVYLAGSDICSIDRHI
jgi:hypothetical protein